MTKAWVFTHRANLQRPMTHDFILEGRTPYAIECKRRNEAGEELGPECFPQHVFPSADAREKQYDSLPDIFFAGSVWVVSTRFANLIRGFDLGAGHLYPVKVTRKDRETVIGARPWYCLNFGNRKTAFLIDQSADPGEHIGDRWMYMSLPRNGDIALSADAIGGPDIWVDTQLFSCIFLSERFGDAINASKMADLFWLQECRVIG